jgi:hypothetical protein
MTSANRPPGTGDTPPLSRHPLTSGRRALPRGRIVDWPHWPSRRTAHGYAIRSSTKSATRSLRAYVYITNAVVLLHIALHCTGVCGPSRSPSRGCTSFA